MPDAVAEPITRAKVLRTVKGTATVGGLSLAGVLALAYPWAQGVSAEQSSIKGDVGRVNAAVVVVQRDVSDVSIAVDHLKEDVAEVAKSTSSVRDMRKSVEALQADSVRIAALEASRASIDTSLRFILENMKAMDAKLDRALERR